MGDASKQKKLRGLLKRLLVLCVSFALFAVLAELVVRWVRPEWAPRTARITKFWRHDERLGWEHVPGTKGRFASYGIDAEVTLNDEGFRGPTVPHARTPDRKRVVVLGDSFVWGFGVGDGDVFTELLRRRLRGLEVVNLGVSGYSTDQELILYRDEGRKYKADLVVLVLCDNDPPGNVRRTQYVIYNKPVFVERDGALVLANVPVPRAPWLKRTLADLAMKSYILNALNRHLGRARQAPVAEGKPRQDERPFPRTPAQKITLRLVEQLRKEAAADGAKFLVVLVEDMKLAGRSFDEALRARGIETIDLAGHIAHDDAALHLPDGFHWNVEGHRIVADVLAPRVADFLQQPH